MFDYLPSHRSALVLWLVKMLTAWALRPCILAEACTIHDYNGGPFSQRLVRGAMMPENMLTHRWFWVHTPMRDATSAALLGGLASRMAFRLRSSLSTAPPFASMLKLQNLLASRPVNVFQVAR
jgi:hypothetical protein